MMLELHVVNLVILKLLEPFKGTVFLTVLEKYGWIKLLVMGVNRIWQDVVIADGKFMTAAIQKTLVLNVQGVTISVTITRHMHAIV
jgi:hypothetical protein